MSTQTLEFTKLHGAGNDFVVINNMNAEITLTPEQVAHICDRHFGVGADGVILVQPSPRPECDAYMHYINSDGTLAQMCGNGVRCFAKFLVDNQIVDPAAGELNADTLAGPRPIKFTLNSDGLMESATVDMGEPILAPAQVPTTLRTDPSDDEAPALDAPLLVSDELFTFTCVSMGNPHAITFINDPLNFPLEKIGPLVECAPEFPERVNVEFAQVTDEGIIMRVWERGCGETLACGTGACATAVAACLTGRAGKQSNLKLLGGTLNISWAEDNHVYMTGPAAQSFKGSLEI